MACYNETTMNTLSLLAETVTYSNGNAEAAGAAFVFLFVALILPFLLILALANYVVTSIFLMNIFTKAGVASWIAWVPFYNQWKLLEIGGQQGFWAVLTIVPIIQWVSMVFIYIAAYHIGKKLGKSGAFVLWAIFLPLVWFIWLGADKSKWNDKASSAPSLHKA